MIKIKRFFRTFFQEINSKLVLTVLSLMVVVHAGIMLYFVQDNRIIRQAALRDEVIQKIINTIYLVEATPIGNRKHAVSAIEDPVIHVSFTKTPKWDLRFSKISFWDISKALRDKLYSFAVSIQLDKEQWLNLNATIYTRVLSKQLIFIGFELLVFLTILISAWSINRFRSPLENFKQAAERLGIDLHTKPLDIYGPKVVREAAGAINQMQKRIQDLIRDRTQMLAAISHDLRTPITRMKIRSQFLDDQSTRDSFIHDIDEMEQMIAETMSFARDDSSTENKSKIDLVSLLQAICEDMQDMGHNVVFISSNLHRAPFFGKRLALKRAFTNLIGNAVRYAKTVEVKISQRAKYFVIKVEDDGPGIPEGELEQVFAPFYRSEQSRSRDTGGVGLGLAVTLGIIKAHQGKITLKNRKHRGLQVTVELHQ